MTAPTKVCSRCEVEKPLTAFSGFRYGRGGVQAWCKACVNEYKRQRRRTAHPERYLPSDAEGVRVGREREVPATETGDQT